MSFKFNNIRIHIIDEKQKEKFITRKRTNNSSILSFVKIFRNILKIT